MHCCAEARRRYNIRNKSHRANALIIGATSGIGRKISSPLLVKSRKTVVARKNAEQLEKLRAGALLRTFAVALTASTEVAMHRFCRCASSVLKNNAGPSIQTSLVATRYFSLDSSELLNRAFSVAKFFFTRYRDRQFLCMIIDEVQKALHLIGEIKTVVDQDSPPELFILTG